MKNGDTQIDTQFSMYRSHTHFVGVVEHVDRQIDQSQVINDVQEYRVGLSRGFDHDWSGQLVVPFLNAKRSGRDGLDLQQFNDPPFPATKDNFGLTSRNEQGNISQLGDIQLMARKWLNQPNVADRGNVQLGIGLKVPTGKFEETNIQRQLPTAIPAALKATADGISTALTGKKVGVAGGLNTQQAVKELVAAGRLNLDSVIRLDDQSIQPGDGGWGCVLTFDGYRKVLKNEVGYLQLLYLANQGSTSEADRALNNPGALANPLTRFLSRPDAYLARIGVNFNNFLGYHTLTASLGLRWEGVPTHDVFGNSLGFRRPGYYIAIEPGLTRTKGKEYFSLRVPISVQRNRQVSVPEEEVGDGSQGDAGFADYSVILNYGRRF